MSDKKFEKGYIIGTFQPLHKGQEYLIQEALKQCEHLTILVGSSNIGISLKNPFTFEQRKEMLESVYPDREKISIFPLNDSREIEWIDYIKIYTADGVIFGREKTGSTYYQNNFSNYIEIEKNSENVQLDYIDAEDIREAIYTHKEMEDFVNLETYLSWNIHKYIYENLDFNYFKELYTYVQKHKTNKILNSTNAFVLCSINQQAYVLLIQRKSVIGRGQWALPGGYLEPNELIFDATLRELYEETNLSKELTYITGETYIVDKVDRSDLGRVITFATAFNLGPVETLPEVKAGDDAEIAKWVLLSDIWQGNQKLFSDHSIIAETLIN